MHTAFSLVASLAVLALAVGAVWLVTGLSGHVEITRKDPGNGPEVRVVSP